MRHIEIYFLTTKNNEFQWKGYEMVFSKGWVVRGCTKVKKK